MRKIVLTLMVLAMAGGAAVLPASAQSSRSEGIVAVVNDDAVSASDLNERMRLVMASSGMPNNPDIREKIAPQILSVLIEEKIKLQEAAKLELEVTQQDIEEGFAAISGQNNMTPEQFRAVLARENVSVSSLQDQIRSQIAWSRVVQSKIRPQIQITENEVDAVLSRLRADVGKEEYRVSEIYLPVDTPADEPEVKSLADRLTGEVASGKVPFGRLASQFSQAAGAAKGGDLGWVQQGQLAEQLETTLSTMKEGEVSRPIRSLSGFHILFLRGKRQITEDTIPGREDIAGRLGMERLDRMQRAYLMDLKAQSFIEQRV